MDRIKDLFAYTKKEQRGMITLLGLILLSIVIHLALPCFIKEKEYDIGPFREEVARFLELQSISDSMTKTEKALYINGHQKKKENYLEPFFLSPYYFDPNNLTKEDWDKMGMDPKVTQNILKYREKGGYFGSIDGFRKIYGMDDGIFSILSPYIVFENRKNKTEEMADAYKDSNYFIKQPKDELHGKEPITIDLNSVDSAGLLILPGIGPYYAAKIIRYRELLGGFIRKEQLLEIRGMDSARYDRISSMVMAKTEDFRKIDLNTAGFKDLLRHPYFEYYLVEAIFKMKDDLIRFDSVEQLKALPVMYRELYEKISPYLKAEAPK